MHREVTLTQDVRCLRKVGATLTFQGEFFRAGSVHTVSPPEKLQFDHRLQSVVSCSFGGQTIYLLVSEINEPGLVSE